MQKFVDSLPELTRVSYLRRNERNIEVSFSFYDSSMIMISGRPWFTPALNKLKSVKRRLERAWSKSHSSDDLKLLRSATDHYHAAVIKAKKTSPKLSFRLK